LGQTQKNINFLKPQLATTKVLKVAKNMFSYQRKTKQI